jgi:hypothetical protein
VHFSGSFAFLILGSTAFHALELGFRTCLIEVASRGINNENINKAFNKIREEHGCVIKSKEVNLQLV